MYFFYSTVFFYLNLVHLIFSSTFRSLSLIGSTFNSVAWTCCKTVQTKIHVILATFCPCDTSHEVQQVELRATYRGDKILPKLVLHNYKSISLHEGTCRCKIIPGHAPAKFSCVCKCCDFVPATCPHYKSLLHVASVCTKQVFVAATCSCDMSLQHYPSSLPTLYTRGHVAATYPWDIYRQHFLVCANVFFFFCPCYMSPLYVPATCRLSMYYTSFI